MIGVREDPSWFSVNNNINKESLIQFVLDLIPFDKEVYDHSLSNILSNTYLLPH